MRAIRVTCPHCGASLQVESAEVVKCEYCGTSSRVQRRTRILERVQPPAAHGPAPIAVQQVNPAVRRTVWIALLIPVACAGIGVWQVQRSIEQVSQGIAASRTPGTASTGAQGQAPAWQGTRPAILVDVDGNGTLDILGRSRDVSAGDEVRLIALDGTTGKRLWQSEPLGTYSDSYQGKLAVAGDLVVFASPRAVVRGFELASGEPRWKTTLDERVKALCAGDAETIIAIGADDVERRLRRADGTGMSAEIAPRPTRSAKKAAACALLPNDDDVSSRDLEGGKLGRRHGVSLAKVFDGAGGRVLAGQRERGTRVAMLVALAEDGTPRWKADVATDPLGAPARDPQHVVVGADVVCASYYAESITEPLRVACFALADGARRWDVVTSTRSLQSLQILGSRLVLSAFGMLEVRDLATGDRVWAFAG